MRASGIAIGLALVATASHAQAVQGGKEDRATTFAVSIVDGDPDAPQLRCSGTLISARVVLTVRHCLMNDDIAFACDVELGAADRKVRVGTAPAVLPKTSWHEVANVVLPKPTKLCGNDIALLVLEEPIEESEAVPARIATRASDFEAAVKSKVLGIAGFGASNPDGGPGTGTRHKRTDVDITCAPPIPGFDCKSDLDPVEGRELTASSGPCSGDIGAGAMGSGDASLVFGVLARGKSADACDQGVYERTDAWSWLLAKTVLEASPSPEAAPVWARDLFPSAPREGDYCRDVPGACGDSAQCQSVDDQRSWKCVAVAAAAPSTEPGKGCSTAVSPPRDDNSSGAGALLFGAVAALIASGIRRRR